MYLDASDSKTEVQFKEVSAEKLARIKSEIRRKAKRTAQIEITVTLLCIAIFGALFYWFTFQ